MAKRIALLSLALVAVMVASVALQPAAFTVERSLAISAAPDAIYPHIASLRAKLEANPAQPAHIQTVHGVGYKFVPDVDI